MKNVAYKTMQNNPNIPDGFIIDHFETDSDVVEGYIVVNKFAFEQLLANNINLIRAFEAKKGTSVAHPNLPPVPVKANSVAEPADPAIIAKIKQEIEDRKKAEQQNQADAALFQQFLEWKRSQQGS